MLFLVDDDEAEIGELHVLCRKRLRADHDLHPAASQALFGLSRLRTRGGPRQASDFDPERSEAFAEGFDMLPRQHGCRHRDRNLFSG